jgi:hypothetical protein|tara:strand:- start:259 stop:504 length:246 start_codon:yes stop_codon:yes gene_type:complete
MKKSYLMTTTTTTKFSGVVEADNENEAFKKIREILPLTHGNVKEIDEPTIENTDIEEISEEEKQHLKETQPSLFSNKINNG